MIFETFDQGDEDTLYDQEKDNDNENTKTKTMTKTNTFRDHIQRATLVTCDL